MSEGPSCEITIPDNLIDDPLLVIDGIAEAAGDLYAALQQLTGTDADIAHILQLQGTPILPPDVKCTAHHHCYAMLRAQLAAAETLVLEKCIRVPQKEDDDTAFWRAVRARHPKLA